MARSEKRDFTRLTLRNRKRNRLSMELLEPRLNLALDVPAFSSLPGANHTIYLDFDGHVTSGTAWNNGATINSPAYSSDADTANFSASELTVIERTFKRVAEDFAPFQVNVTTVAPTIENLRNTGGTDTKWGVRAVVTKDVAFNCGCGGIAYIDSFDWNSDTPVFVFNTGEVGVAEAASHEVGHSLGLSHDGTSTSGYYQGHGLGPDTAYWSTIMGVGYYVDVSQWDKGEYTGSNNANAGANYNKGPDDLFVITNYNGFGYKSDDHGNDAATASPLNVVGTAVSGSGTITTRTDVDYFRFTTSAGAVTLNVNSAPLGANLDIEATLYNSVGTLVASSNPLLSLNANISAFLDAGTYYLKVDGTGAGTPTATPPTGYSDYASIGQYSISGTIGAVAGDTMSIVATDASKNELNSGGTVFTFTVNRTGDPSGTSTVNYAVTGSGSSPASPSDFVGGVLPPAGTLTFSPGVTSLPVTVNVQGDTTVESNETFLVSISSSSSATLIGVASAIGTIVNDDVAQVLPTLGISATSAIKNEGTGTASTPFGFRITRAGSLTAASSVLYTVSGTGLKPANSTDFAGGFARNV
ncbi:MAG: Calx-beta domain-containing protein, partial [Pirellula staleyi]